MSELIDDVKNDIAEEEGRKTQAQYDDDDLTDRITAIKTRYGMSTAPMPDGLDPDEQVDHMEDMYQHRLFSVCSSIQLPEDKFYEYKLDNMFGENHDGLTVPDYDDFCIKFL